MLVKILMWIMFLSSLAACLFVITDSFTELVKKLGRKPTVTEFLIRSMSNLWVYALNASLGLWLILNGLK